MKKQGTIYTFEFHEMILDEKAAIKWFEQKRWPEGRYCPHCGSVETLECTKPQPYRCKSCRKHFSAKTGTVLQSSKLPVKKWLYAMYLMSVSKKGLSSPQLSRKLGIAQEAAWRLGHKIREAWNQDAILLDGDVEVDETYIGGNKKNKHASKKLKAGRGVVGKQAVLGMKQCDGQIRASPIARTDKPTLAASIKRKIEFGSVVYTDCHKGYCDMR